MAIACSAYQAVAASDVTQAPAVVAPDALAPGVGEKLVVAAGTTAKPLTRPELGIVLAMVVAVVLSWSVGAFAIAGDGTSEGEWFKPAEGVTVFAIFYVIAQAIERLLVPIARLVPTTPHEGAPPESTTRVLGVEFMTRSLAARHRAKAVEVCATPAPDLETAMREAQSAANWQEVLQQAYVNATTVWALGAAFAFLLCGALDVYLLNSIGVADWNPPVELDLLVTGLAVGGGTVPLHGLIDRVQKTDDKQSSNTSTSPTPGGGRVGVVV